MLDGMTIPNCAKGQATGTVIGLRVREAAVNGAVLGTLRQDEVVDVWAVVNGWGIVQTVSGLTGWASMEYLKPMGELRA
jgi:sugar phosphate permease